MKKRYKFILLTTMIMFIGINECYAEFGHNVENYSIYSGGDSESGKKPHDSVAGWKPSSSSSSYTYSCEYDYSIHSSNSLVVDMLDQNGESVVTKNSSGSITFSKSLIAGTAIKVNVTETKARWFVLTDDDVTASYTEEKIELVAGNCTYTKYEDCGILGLCNPSNVAHCVEGKYCTKSCTSYSITSTVTTTYTKGSSQHSECKQAAISQLQSKIDTSVGPSYTIRVQNPNYSNATGDDIIAYEITNPATSCTNIENGKKCTFTYVPESICMNVKTAKVSYRTGDNCIENEMKVHYTTKFGKTYWDYFSPLDSKQKNNFSFNMVRSSQAGVQPKEFCQQLINQEPGYTNFIKTSNGEELSDNKNNALMIVEEGCLLQTEVPIPLIQKFYKEEIPQNGNSSKFKGFNFYYKPIDINNPFPNELAQNSLWREWKINKQANKENPKFSESFKTITYEALNINANTIRDYNAKIENTKNEITGVFEDTAVNAYTNWQKMNVNGSSQYIEDAANENGIIKRYVDNNSFYNLGCGPANKDWEGCK